MQQETAEFWNQMCEDEGYSGSQEQRTSSTAVSLESSEEDNFFANFFSETPNLQDISFDIMWAQASAIAHPLDDLPFGNL